MSTINLTHEEKEAYFRKMFEAHDTIAEILERADKLRCSATYISPKWDDISSGQPNPKKFEKTVSAMVDLKTRANKLLQQRAVFDLFISSLEKREVMVLKLRCCDGMTWRQIAGELRVSQRTAQELFRQIGSKAEDAGCFSDVTSEKDC